MRLITKALAATIVAGTLSTLAVAGPTAVVSLDRPNGPIGCCPQ